MKINFNKITQIIKRYKYVLLFLIVIVIFLCSSSSIVEGLTGNIGEYDYLAPINRATENINDETWRRFLSRMAKTHGNDILPKDIPSDILSTYKTQYGSVITKGEIEYYINNGKFPYNGYVMKYLKNNPLPNRQPNYNSSEEIEKMQIGLPNRVVYKDIILPAEESKKPLPLSVKIYLGQEKPPSSYTITSTAAKTNSNSQNKAYNQFVNLCKKIVK